MDYGTTNCIFCIRIRKNYTGGTPYCIDHYIEDWMDCPPQPYVNVNPRGYKCCVCEKTSDLSWCEIGQGAWYCPDHPIPNEPDPELEVLTKFRALFLEIQSCKWIKNIPDDSPPDEKEAHRVFRDSVAAMRNQVDLFPRSFGEDDLPSDIRYLANRTAKHILVQMRFFNLGNDEDQPFNFHLSHFLDRVVDKVSMADITFMFERLTAVVKENRKIDKQRV